MTWPGHGKGPGFRDMALGVVIGQAGMRAQCAQ